MIESIIFHVSGSNLGFLARKILQKSLGDHKGHHEYKAISVVDKLARNSYVGKNERIVDWMEYFFKFDALCVGRIETNISAVDKY